MIQDQILLRSDLAFNPSVLNQPLNAPATPQKALTLGELSCPVHSCQNNSMYYHASRHLRYHVSYDSLHQGWQTHCKKANLTEEGSCAHNQQALHC